MKKGLLVFAMMALSFGISAAAKADETPASDIVSLPAIERATDAPTDTPAQAASETIDSKATDKASDAVDQTAGPVDDKASSKGDNGMIDPIAILPIDDNIGDSKDTNPQPVTPPSSGTSSSGGAVMTPAAAKDVSIAATEKSATPETLSINALALSGYGNGTLLRDAVTKKIYIVRNGKLEYIRSLNELRKYSGRRIINLSSKTIASYLAN